MRRARVGDRIKILDNNGGSWVTIGNVYEVTDVDDPDNSQFERRYTLDGVANFWYAEPRHFEIFEAKTHSRYSQFKRGDVVCRWRDVEEWEWGGIGDIALPDLGDPITVDAIDIGSKHKEDSFSNDYHGWYPMKAFVLSQYYNTITNLGTGVLNTTEHGKINQGRTIEVQRSTASIVTGKRRTGSRVQGRGNATIVGGGYTRHKACYGR
jgi:hypothetical protein